MKKSLRDYQVRALDTTYAWMQANDGHALMSVPTGGGKALLIAKICEESTQYPNQHIMCCVHSKELVRQNFEEFHGICPTVKAGIYCAGLGKKEIRKITFASIASVCKIKKTPWVDLLIIDEVQAVNDENEESRYASFIAKLEAVNPNIRIIGLSATIWRTRTGLLCEGENRLFKDVAYEQPIIELINEGYLVRLVSKDSEVKGNRDNITISGGEFQIKSAATEFDRAELTEAAIQEALKYGSDRKSWIVFCITKEHALHVRDALREHGIEAESVTDDTPEAERDRLLKEFKEGKIRALCSINIAAVGFNAPCVDLIIGLRPTQSCGWHVQSLGRGTRPVYAPGFDLSTREGRLAAIASGPKPNCLVLDHAGNLENMGPITHVNPPRKNGKKKDENEDEEENGRVCPTCRSVNEKGAKECSDCGYVFPIVARKVKHSKEASHAPVMLNEPKITEVPNWFDVLETVYEIHTKFGSPPSVKVSYKLAHTTVQEWIGFEHPKEYPKKLAAKWWLMRGGQSPVPATADDALSRMEEIDGFRADKILVKKDQGWNRIVQHSLIKNDIPLDFEDGNISTYYIQRSKPKEIKIEHIETF